MVVNGWRLFYFKLFAEILTSLENEVRAIAEKNPEDFEHHPKTKLLADVFKSITEDVPANPMDRKFMLGKTLGKQYADWRRVKRGLPNRYRLFFRFTSTQKSVIYAWLNDENTLRKEGSKNDVYTVFARMLANGSMPNSIDELLKASLQA